MTPCAVCGYYEHQHYTCEECGQFVHMGEWYNCPHGFPAKAKGFEPFFDVGLNRTITGVGDVHQACRPQWNGDYIEKLEPRDLPDSYYRELNEHRRARAEEAKRNANR